MKRFVFAILLAAMGVLLFAPVSSDAYVYPDGHERRFDTHKWVGLGGFQFLKVGQGARAVAMGDAYTAVADDINAIFWNPAGLVHIRGTAWTATYTDWLVNSKLFSAAVAYNTGSGKGGVLGISVVAFRPDEMEETTIFQPQGTGQKISAGDMAIGFVYALKLTDKFSFASRLSWVHQTLYTYSVNAMSLDVGTMFYTGFKSLRLAMSLRHFGPDKKITDTKFFMPLAYNVGAAAEVYGEKGDPAYVTASVETLFQSDYELRAHAGAELWVSNIVALRGGYKMNYDTDSWCVGAGLKYEIAGDKTVNVDVSYSAMGEYLKSPLRVTIGGTF